MRRSISVPWVAAALGLQFLGFLLYANTLRNEPVWDDHDMVFNQAFLRRCGNLKTVLDPRTLYSVLPVRNSARPVWLASVLADSCLSGDRVWGFRLTNILWHAWGGLCLMALMWRLSRDGLATLAAGTLFVAHPLHTEPVDLIAFRPDLLAFAWASLALLLYLEGRGRSPGKALALACASLICFALALLSKEMAVTLPFLILLADWLFPEKSPAPSRRLGVYSAYGLVLLLYIVFFRAPRSGYLMRGHEDLFSHWRGRIAAAAAPASTPAPAPVMDPPPWSEDYFGRPAVRFLTMSRVFGSYLRLLAWPHPLQADYAPRPVSSWADGGVWASWFAWLSLFAAAWRRRRRSPLVSFGLLWIPATLLPVSGLIALKNLQAERYLYFASAGFCLALAGVSQALSRARAVAACAAVAVAFSALTIVRNRDYRDDLSFYRATAAVDPGVPRVHLNLAQAWAYEGRPELAEAEFRTSLSLWSKSANGRIRFARFLVDQGRAADAASELETGLSQLPGDPSLSGELARLTAHHPTRKRRPH